MTDKCKIHTLTDTDNRMRYVRALFFENEKDRENEEQESYNVVPPQALVLHYKQYDDSEDCKRNSLLNDFQLPNGEGSAELSTAAAVGGYHKAILGKCHEPTQKDDGEQPKTFDFALEEDLPIPRERHEDIGTGQKHYGEYSS